MNNAFHHRINTSPALDDFIQDVFGLEVFLGDDLVVGGLVVLLREAFFGEYLAPVFLARVTMEKECTFLAR